MHFWSPSMGSSTDEASMNVAGWMSERTDEMMEE